MVEDRGHLPDLSALVPGLRTATASAISTASRRRLRLPCSGSASTPSGCRRSTPRRWPISATTSPTTATSIRCFGTLADFDALIAEAHARGLKLILDFVPNHTSDQHPWFIESRVSRGRTRSATGTSGAIPAPGGGPPNNWLSEFGGSAWECDEGDRPVLLPRIPQGAARPQLAQSGSARGDVRRAALLARARRRRLSRRRDLASDQGRRISRQPAEPGLSPRRSLTIDRLLQVHSADRPEVHEVIAEMRRSDRRISDDRVLIGEIYLPLERLMAYYGRDLNGAHLPFNFQLLRAPWKRRRHCQARSTNTRRRCPQAAWPNWVLGNHDRPRIATQRRARSRRGWPPMLLLTLRGTPTLYYGDEIGMADVPIPPEQIQDPWALGSPKSVSAAIRIERRCNGIVQPMRVLPRHGLGSPWRTIGPSRTWRISSASSFSILSL